MTLLNTPGNILRYKSTIWSTADLLRGCGIKESEWPAYMTPFFAMMMLESRLLRMLEELKAEFGEETLAALAQTAPADESKNDLIQHIQDRGLGRCDRLNRGDNR